MFYDFKTMLYAFRIVDCVWAASIFLTFLSFLTFFWSITRKTLSPFRYVSLAALNKLSRWKYTASTRRRKLDVSQPLVSELLGQDPWFHRISDSVSNPFTSCINWRFADHCVNVTPHSFLCTFPSSISHNLHLHSGTIIVLINHVTLFPLFQFSGTKDFCIVTYISRFITMITGVLLLVQLDLSLIVLFSSVIVYFLGLYLCCKVTYSTS